EVVRILIKSGADVNIPSVYASDRSQIALVVAVTHGNSDIVKILIDSGAKINALHTSGDNKTTALQAAAKRGNMELARLLIDAGADVNAPASNSEYG
ncbi:ankyrin, partial [Wilcoxina mikolae CBS 423.85]